MIYLDNAATTKPDQEALSRAQEYLTTNYFNPSGLYREGFALQSELCLLYTSDAADEL